MNNIKTNEIIERNKTMYNFYLELEQTQEEKIELDIDFIYNNQSLISEVINKHSVALKKVKDKTRNKSFFLGVSHFILINAIVLLPNFFIGGIESDYLKYSLLFSLICFSAVVIPIESGEESALNCFKNYCLSFIFKNKNNYFLTKSVTEEYGFVSKKGKKIIEDFQNNLNLKELQIYNEFINKEYVHTEVGELHSLETVIYKTVKDFLLNKTKKEILINKDVILSLIDMLEETSIDEAVLTELYINKVDVNGKYKNKKLNQLNQIKDHSFKNENIVIKQI
jgi:hypothetical protein